MNIRGIVALAAVAVVLQGCAGPSFEAAKADRDLCNLARVQRAQGDPRWNETIDKMQSLQAVSHCLNTDMAQDMGMLNGP